MKSFCHRWDIDLYDRIIEVHLTERSTAAQDWAALRSLQLATFSAGLVPLPPFGPNEVVIPQLERTDAEVYIHGFEGTNGFWASHRVLVVFGNIPRPEIRTGSLLMPLADYRPEKSAIAIDPFVGLPIVKAPEFTDIKNTTDPLHLLVCSVLSPDTATCHSVPHVAKDP